MIKKQPDQLAWQPISLSIEPPSTFMPFEIFQTMKICCAWAEKRSKDVPK